jgi:ectoine hydroxylase-related dioxygenase (phytanoyl-CoA dioxygenase family)
MSFDIQAQVKTPFERDGFAVLRDFVPSEWIETLRATTDRLLDSTNDATVAKYIDWEPTPDAQSLPQVQRIRRPHEVDAAFDRLARSDFLLDAVEALIGPNIRLHHSKINIKAPHVGSPLEWHQDWAFIPHTHPGMAIVAIAMDACEEVNGPVRFIPGSHRGPLHDHHSEDVFFGAIDPGSLDIDQAVHATGQAGLVSIHHPLTVHGSGFNQGTHDRRILFLEYAAADAWPLFYGVQWDEYNRRIVRGQPTSQVRVEPMPVRMPYPTATEGQGKIYDQQQRFAKKFFTAPEKAQA